MINRPITIRGKTFRNELLRNQAWLKIGGILLLVSAFLEVIFFINRGPNTFYYAIYCGFLLAAIVMLIQAFKFWTYKWLGLFLHVAIAILNLFFAIIYIKVNVEFMFLGLIILMISYFIVGVFRIYIASTQGIFYLGWEWTFLCGIVNLILILVIYFELNTPFSTLIFVSLIDFFFTGIALLMLGIGADQLKKTNSDQITVGPF